MCFASVRPAGRVFEQMPPAPRHAAMRTCRSISSLSSCARACKTPRRMLRCWFSGWAFRSVVFSISFRLIAVVKRCRGHSMKKFSSLRDRVRPSRLHAFSRPKPNFHRSFRHAQRQHDSAVQHQVAAQETFFPKDVALLTQPSVPNLAREEEKPGGNRKQDKKPAQGGKKSSERCAFGVPS